MTLGTKLVTSFLAAAMVALNAAGAFASDTKPGGTPDEAMARLKAGNTRFVAGEPVHPNTNSARIADTFKNGQHPFATVITCSDSRVPVERVFDQGIGDVFIIRVAGNVCDVDEVGSIEYGVDHLATPVLVVLGHTNCGAVTAVVTKAELHGSIPALVDNIAPAVATAQKNNPSLGGKALVPEAVKANVWQSIDDLFKTSPATRKRVDAGTLKVVGAVYDIADGRVEWLGTHSEQGRLLAYTGGPPHSGGTYASAGHGASDTTAPEETRGAPAHGTGSAEEGSHAAAGAAHVAMTVKAETVTLINPSELAELDKARHRKVDVAVATMAQPEQGISFMWKLGIALAVVLGVGGIFFKSGAVGRMGVAGKLYLGFGAVVVLALVIGWVGYTSLEQVNKKSALATAALEMDMMADEIRGLQRNFLLVGIEDRERGEEILKEHKALTEEYGEDFIAIRAYGLDQAEAAAIDSMTDATGKYEKVFAELVEKFHKIEKDKEELDELGEQMDEQIADVLHKHESELVEMLASGASASEIAVQTELIEKLARCEILALKVAHNEVGFLLDKRIGRVNDMELELGELRGTLKVVEELIPLAAKDKAEETSDLGALTKVEHELDQYQEILAEMIKNELIVAADVIDADADLDLIGTTAIAFSQRAGHIAETTRHEAEQTAVALMAIVAVVGTLLAFFCTRGITKPINRIIVGLNEGADQVNDAAAQVSSASQQLAEGASEQASSLEETSSALEQMAAMTRTNAQNAKQANELSDQAKTAAQSGDKTMEQLNSAMVAINDSSGQISKIIKVIEEIAFQTNLLALNAAVEAARAGEHGKGFAVVADEVRNLAQRAAQAARETTGLIEDSINKAKEGTDVAGEVGKALGAIVGDVTKVTDLVEGIAQASNEQAQGVEQVNTAVSQMDKVTQQNASGAEESASAAEELSAQANTVKGMVEELSAVVGSSDSRCDQGVSRSSGESTTKGPRVQVAHPSQTKKKAPAKQQQPVGAATGSGSAGKQDQSNGFMELDDDNLKDF